ncbi:helix-turn-helix transcriptional regulator [Celeribacter litoreus]|uniref:helix-turn-helix transcriptional regulator n=1 Tax=Celeribacter litoreus TaxID=2876714 RepID=UPI001CCE81E8|nr:HTH domain-containing protein [Celeribacter litoreus]MCA0045288.1 HTH domain-containing protein [Celeribacter litoreus]
MSNAKASRPKKSERLYALIQILRDGALHTAGALAQQVGVSERTIWRDMAALKDSGLPVEGERGVGYRITAPITLPPINLTLPELEALTLAVAILGEASDPELAASAQSLAAKIDAVLPENTEATGAGWSAAVHPYAFADARSGFRHMPLLREAVRAHRVLRITYSDDTLRQRLVHPLQLDFWGRIWTMGVWCETTGHFDVLRLDRIEAVIDTGAIFADAEARLEDFLIWRRAQASGG